MIGRRALLVLEVSLALTLVAATVVAFSQLVVLVVHQRREAEWAGVAARETANLMEQAMILPWEEITAERLNRLELSPETRRRLPSAELSVTMDAGDEEERRGTRKQLQMKEIQVVVRWRGAAGRAADPAVLTAWRFAPRDGD